LHGWMARSSHSLGPCGMPAWFRRRAGRKRSRRLDPLLEGPLSPSRGTEASEASCGGHASDHRLSVARSTSSRRRPRSVAGKTTPTRVRSFCVNEGGAPRPPSPGSGVPSSGKSNRTRSTRARPSNSSSAKRPMARGVARGAGSSSLCAPSSHTSPRSQRRSNTHCPRSTSGNGSGGVRVTATSGGEAGGAAASSARLTSMARRGWLKPSASADSANAAPRNDAAMAKRTRTKRKAATQRGRRQEQTKVRSARPGRARWPRWPRRGHPARSRARRAKRCAAAR
jgi:hypothetical protein